MESLVDFGHAKQIFEDADVFPCILVAVKPADGREPPVPRVCSIPREQLRIDDLSQQIQLSGTMVDRTRFGAAAWSLSDTSEVALIEKLRSSGRPLSDFSGVSPNAGFATGLNEAFVIDGETRDRLIRADHRSAEIIRPYIRGQDMEPWQACSAGYYIIFTKRGINIDDFPAIRQHLTSYRLQLEPKPEGWSGETWAGRKPGRYQWYEIQDSAEYWEELAQPKLIYPDITWRANVSFDSDGSYFSKTVYYLPTNDFWLLAVLNSPIGWWFSWRTAIHGKDEALRFFKPFVEAFPIPEPSAAQRTEVDVAVRRLIAISKIRQTATQAITDWLKVEMELEKLSLKLQQPLELDADAFAAEVKKARGKKRPLTSAGLAALRAEHAAGIVPARSLAGEMLTLERRLSDLVNAAYGLTPDEVKLMWDTAPPRMPLASQG